MVAADLTKYDTPLAELDKRAGKHDDDIPSDIRRLSSSDVGAKADDDSKEESTITSSNTTLTTCLSSASSE